MNLLIYYLIINFSVSCCDYGGENKACNSSLRVSLSVDKLKVIVKFDFGKVRSIF